MTANYMTANQQLLMKQLLADEYSINLTKAYVIKEKESIIIEKGTTFKGVVSIGYNTEASFFGMLKSYDSIVTLSEETFFIDNPEVDELLIHFTIDTTDLEPETKRHALIGVIYLGGELTVPLNFTVVHKRIQEKVVLVQQESELAIRSNALSYQIHDQGYFELIGAKHQETTIKIIEKDKGIKFSQDIYYFYGDGQIPFCLEITHEDTMRGLVPIHSQPEHQMKVVFQIQSHGDKINTTEYIKVTGLKKVDHIGGLSRLEWANNMTSELIHQFEEEMVNSIIFDYKSHKKEALRHLLGLLEVLIAKDLTNINYRLFYAFLAIDLELYHIALEEINQIDRFILFYDQYFPDISDILMCLMALLKQDKSVDSLVGHWKAEDQGNWVKIILKNKIVSNRFKEYEEYKTLFNSGIRDVFLIAEAFAFINKNNYLPKGEDFFYKELITFGAIRRAITTRFLRKIEASGYYLVHNHYISSEATEYLYNEHQNKHLLLLLVMSYIAEDNLSEKACDIYERCLKEQLTVKELLEFYIRSSYKNRRLLDMTYFRLAFDIEGFELPCQRFIWLNFILFQGQFPILVNYYIRKYGQPPKLYIEDIILPEADFLIHQFIQYLIEDKAYGLLRDLYGLGIYKQLSADMQIELLNCIAQVDKLTGQKYAMELVECSIQDKSILTLAINNFSGPTEKMALLVAPSLNYDIHDTALYNEFLIRCILTRQHIDLLEAVYLKIHESINSTLLELLILRYISASIIVEAYEVTRETTRILIQKMVKYEEIGIEIAVLKMCAIDTTVRSKHILEVKQLLEKHIHMGVVFPFYGQLVDGKAMGHNFRAQHYFEYYANGTKQLNFCYRLDDEDCFTKLPMHHIVFGLFLTKVVLFFGEYIQYYIEEVNQQERDIKVSDVFTKVEAIELQDEDNIFDIINTIEMSKMFQDEESLEKAIETYLRVGDNQLGKVFLL